MSIPCSTRRGLMLSAFAAAVLALNATPSFAKDRDDDDRDHRRGISQSGEQKDMRRVGHTDLQGRPAYQPNVHQLSGRKDDRVRRHARRHASRIR